MRNDWIVDVLADLKAFAVKSGLPVLAEQLDDTAIVALAEIAAHTERTNGELHGDTGASREDIGGIGAGRIA